MPRFSQRIVVALMFGMLGCSGGNLGGTGGPDGGTRTIPCSAMGACACMAASDRCVASTEACWCPSECDPNIACICGGGRFLSCQDRTSTTTVCSTALAAVQAKCAGQPNVQYIGDVCTPTPTSTPAASPSCVAACLSNLATTGSCAEIDCYFCPVCDCAPQAPSPFRDCLAACRGAQPD